MTSLDDCGPVLTPVEAAALQNRSGAVAWFVLPAPSGNGVIARAHTEALDGGRLLPGHLAAKNLDELRSKLPPGLHLDSGHSSVWPPGCLELWWQSD